MYKILFGTFPFVKMNIQRMTQSMSVDFSFRRLGMLIFEASYTLCHIILTLLFGIASNNFITVLFVNCRCTVIYEAG